MTAPDEDFASMLDASISARNRSSKIKVGSPAGGVIVQISDSTIFVDVGTRSEAEIDRSELTDKDGDLTVQVGDSIRATVARGGDQPKLVMSLSRGHALDVSAIEMARDAGVPVEGVVRNAVKAGLEIDLSGIRAFCPASQVDRTYTEDLTIYEGQSMQFKVLEVRDNGRSVVVSRRALLEAARLEQADELLAGLAEGAIVEGTVISLKPFGAFVDIGGVEGLVHISELGEGRVDQVADVVSVGEVVQVKVLAVEHPAPGSKDRAKIRLSMRSSDRSAAPRRSSQDRAKVVPGTVTGVEIYGVFVQTELGQGLVANRELDLPTGGDPRRAFPTGTEVQVAHLGADPNGRLRFSIKKVAEIQARAEYEAFQATPSGAKGVKGMGSLGDLLKSRLGDVDVPDAVPSKPEEPDTSTSSAARRRKVSR